MEESNPSTTSALNVSRGVKTATFYGWKYNQYFVVIEEGEKTCEFIGCCVHPAKRHCPVLITQHLNFKKHLDTVHKATKLVGKEPAKETEKQSRDGAEDDDGPPGAKRQCTLLNKPAISPTKLRS